jgi:hypothetical protein
VDYRDDLLNLRTACKLKLPHLTGEELTKQLQFGQKNKTLLTSQLPGKTMTELLLKCQHQDWMLKD